SGSFERPLVKEFTRVVRQGMTVVDIGANVGFYTLVASRLVGAAGQVVAFEPDPRLHGYLTRNLQDNNCTNVIARQAAVTDHAGTARFTSDPGGTGGRVSEEAGDAVEAVALDDLDLDVDVVKMDIEGGEVRALAGM